MTISFFVCSLSKQSYWSVMIMISHGSQDSGDCRKVAAVWRLCPGRGTMWAHSSDITVAPASAAPSVEAQSVMPLTPPRRLPYRPAAATLSCLSRCLHPPSTLHPPAWALSGVTTCSRCQGYPRLSPSGRVTCRCSSHLWGGSHAGGRGWAGE